jgi:hypothetical protein
VPDGYILSVEFDSIKDMRDQKRYEAGNIESSGLGEAADFYGWLIAHWTEDSEADIDWATDTVVVSSETLARLLTPIQWLAKHTRPVQIHITRQVPARKK